MSYILDALKKSEEERQRGSVPDLLSAYDAISEKPRKRSLRLYSLVIALLVIAAGFGWWLGAWQLKKERERGALLGTQGQVTSPASVPTPAQRTSDNRTPVVAPDATKGAKKEASEAKAAQAPKAEPSVAPAAKSPTSGPAPKDQARKKDSDTPTTRTVVEGPVEPLKAPAVAESRGPGNKKIFNLKELPQSVQQALPAFLISVHIHSTDEASRMVRINNQMLREGQELSAGVKLEEVAADGVILSYKNYYFRVGLP